MLALHGETHVGASALLVAGFVFLQEVYKSQATYFMKKKILYVFLGALLFIVVIAATDDTADNTTTQPNTVEITEVEETAEEQQARWNRGEFTIEEIAELEAEEAREDTAIERFDEQKQKTT